MRQLTALHEEHKRDLRVPTAALHALQSSLILFVLFFFCFIMSRVSSSFASTMCSREAHITQLETRSGRSRPGPCERSRLQKVRDQAYREGFAAAYGGHPGEPARDAHAFAATTVPCQWAFTEPPAPVPQTMTPQYPPPQYAMDQSPYPMYMGGVVERGADVQHETVPAEQHSLQWPYEEAEPMAGDGHVATQYTSVQHETIPVVYVDHQSLHPPYEHAEPEAGGAMITDCWYFRHGSCWYGKHCHYRHSGPSPAVSDRAVTKKTAKTHFHYPKMSIQQFAHLKLKVRSNARFFLAMKVFVFPFHGINIS